MEFIKYEKEYKLSLQTSNVTKRTEELPIKWHCEFVREENKSRLKFLLLSRDYGVDDSALTYVSVSNILSLSDDPALYIHSLVGSSEIVFDLNSSEKVPFYFGLRLRFVVLVPKRSNQPFVGYDLSEANPANDKTLVIGSKKFHVNKSVLSAYSSYFDNLFNNENFEESKKNEIELKELDAEEFEVLLHIIFPSNVCVNDANVEFVWKLADRFNITTVYKMCEGFICNRAGKQTLTVAKRMELALFYKSEKLMNALKKQMENMNI